jgi:hypothetical protein
VGIGAARAPVTVKVIKTKNSHSSTKGTKNTKWGKQAFHRKAEARKISNYSIL